VRLGWPGEQGIAVGGARSETSPSDTDGVESCHLWALDLPDGTKGRASGDKEVVRDALGLEGGGTGGRVVAETGVVADEGLGLGRAPSRVEQGAMFHRMCCFLL
jgi:hypothetical protein